MYTLSDLTLYMVILAYRHMSSLSYTKQVIWKISRKINVYISILTKLEHSIKVALNYTGKTWRLGKGLCRKLSTALSSPKIMNILFF